VYAMAGNTSSVRYGVGPYQASDALFDVIGGSNGKCNGTYMCNALPGYDGPTGLGTPNGLGAFSGECGGQQSGQYVLANGQCGSAREE